ncbi:MAG TPA: hypothetical protein VF703_17545 [Pyrinomonadaceae bacterium]|jgi:hypothetical protein
MQETQKFFEPTRPVEHEETIVHEPDATLATPRFDEVEAQVARPVVPLAGRPAGSVLRRRQWPIALVLISALAGGVVSLLAFRLYQQRQQSPAVASEVENGTPEAADATASPAPIPADTAVAATEGQAPVVFEEFDPAKEGGAVSDAAPSRPQAAAATAVIPAARKDEPKEEVRTEAKPAPRAAEPKPRLVETLPAPRQVEARHQDTRRADDGADEEEFYDRRRERRRQQREQRREQRRGQQRNIDRIKDIFEGAPPS